MNWERLSLVIGIFIGVVITIYMIVPFLNSLSLPQRFSVTNWIIVICVVLAVILFKVKKK